MFDNFQLTSLAVIPVLGLLIFVHELGHFLAARWMGVRVLEFGFGYPPRAKTLFTRNGVEYTLNWLPFGGFVRMAGEDGDFEAAGSLLSVAPWRRIVVLFAGPFMNFVTAVFLFALLLLAGTPQFTGDPNELRVAIVGVAVDSPAGQAGLQAGDIILAIEEAEVRGIDNVSAGIAARAGQATRLTVERAGEMLTVILTPRLPQEIPAGEGATGVRIQEYIESGQWELVRAGPVAALAGGLESTRYLTARMIEGLATLLRALILPRETLPEGGVGGLVAIGRIAAEVAREGWRDLVNLTAFLSVNLAILNLLPIPALDGGRITFALIEMLRRRRIPPEKEAMVHLAGYALLLAMMVLITFVDVSNWIAGRPPLPGG
ncbi:MAG: site-2 protease family protein [Caldilineales bacterium]|nr:site-2 protease family protein [Caldilineales bacterium]